MKSQHRRLAVFFLVMFGISILVSGCNFAPSKTGFIPEYYDLKPILADKSAFIWVRDRVEWDQYKRFIVDPVIVYFGDDIEKAAISPRDLIDVTAYFRKSLIKEISKTARVVNKPGDDVLRLRIAIVGIIPTNPTNEIINPKGFYLPMDFREASIEVKVINSISSRMDAGYVEFKLKRPKDPFSIGHITRMEYLEPAIDDWTKRIWSMVGRLTER